MTNRKINYAYIKGLLIPIFIILLSLISCEFVFAYTPRLDANGLGHEYTTSNPYYPSHGMPNCVCYAWGRAYELLGTKPNLSTGNAKEWWGYNKDRRIYEYGSEPALGAIACWGGGETGHVAVVEEIDGNKITISESNYYGDYFRVNTFYKGLESNYVSGFQGYIYILGKQGKHGSYMNTGYDRVLPDGDYIIAHTGNSNYFLDIQGIVYPADNDTNVDLWHADEMNISDVDIWTIRYNDGFYTITQRGTNKALDVYCASDVEFTNVQVYDSNDCSAQKWAISQNGNNGYRLQARCSGFSLDIENGVIGDGTNIRQCDGNSSNAQSWLFIPYKPSQPIDEGRYILLYGADPSYELDVPGDTGDINNSTPMELWKDTAPSKYNSFDFIKLPNGYYKVKHAASGKCLDVSESATNYKCQVALYDDIGSTAQQWAVIKSGTGYSLIARNNGYALDLPGGATSNGSSIEMYPVMENNNQRWTFVKAEHTVSYNGNGGNNSPESQTKYYKTGLEITKAVPEREGYKFLGWSRDANDLIAEYKPGDMYSGDEDITLYAVWEILNPPTLKGGKFNMLVGDSRYWRDFVVLSHDGVLGYTLEVIDSTGSVEVKGDQVIAGKEGVGSVTVRIVEYPSAICTLNINVIDLSDTIILPDDLTVIEEGAFENSGITAVSIPLKCSVIGKRAFANNSGLVYAFIPESVVTIESEAFSDCPGITIYCYENSMAHSFARDNDLQFVLLSRD